MVDNKDSTLKRKTLGIWIPIHIWDNQELTLQEKVVLTEIESFDHGSGCWASNRYFGAFMGVSKDRAGRIISLLVDKGLITSRLVYHPETKQILKRYLKISIPPTGQSTATPNGRSTVTPDGGSTVDININNINKKDSIGKVASQPSPIVNDKNPNGVFIQKANRVIDHLNKTTKKNLKKIDANRKEIISRLKDGYQYKEFIQVINTKSKDPFFTDNPKYMRVATLFCKKNFDSYLNEDPKQYKKNSANNIGSGTGNIDFTKTQTMEEFMESSK